MFDVDQRDDVRAVTDLARSLASDLVGPGARGAEAAAKVPDALLDALFATGMTVPVPEDRGGGGIPSCAAHLAFVEALAAGDPGIAVAACSPAGAALLVAAIGTEDQRARLLPPMAAARPRAAVAMTEGFGRAPSEAATTVALDGSGVRVRGRKLGVPGAVGADPLMVVGVDPNDGRVRIVVLADGDGARALAPAGRIALGAAELATVEVDATAGLGSLLGGPDADPDATALAVARLRLMNAASLIGTAQRAVDYASHYATERLAFGKPIAAFQGVSFLMADAALRVGAARLEMMDAAWRIDRGEAAGIEETVTRAVNYAGSVAMQATRDAVQVLGGHGFITDHPVELWYRSAAALAVLDCDPLASPFEPAL